jgi:importin-9
LVWGPSIEKALLTNTIRWRPLEAALAVVGSQADAIQDCVNDEEDSGRCKPINITFLLSDVVPSILSLSGISYVTPDEI